MIRTHITWSGKARDLPRLSQVYADAFPAMSGMHASEDDRRKAIQSHSSVTQGGRLPQSRPAADRGGAR